METTNVPEIETSVVAPSEHDKFTQEEYAKAVQEYSAATGKSFIMLESDWWGNESLGVWSSEFFADVAHVTEDDDGNPKGMKLENVVDASFVRSFLYQKKRAEEELRASHNGYEVKSEHLTETYYAQELNEAKAALSAKFTPGNSKISSGWLPASKVTYRYDHPGPQNIVQFTGTKDDYTKVRKGEVDVLITDTTDLHTKYGVYRKLKVDAPYHPDKSPKQVNDEWGWDRYHVQAKYVGDNFECWTADPEDPEGFARCLAEVTGWKVGVAEDLIDGEL